MNRENVSEQSTNQNDGGTVGSNYSAREKRVFYSAIARAVLMGVALVATVWVIGKLNSGTLFSGGSTTATLFGISANRSQ